MFYYPRLVPTDVPGSSRCCFTFFSQETMQRTDDYTGKRRFHFNKWLPISATLPTAKAAGMRFECNQWSSLTGIVSAFGIDQSDPVASVEIVIGPQDFVDYDPTIHQTELGVGFLKYTEDWWELTQACELLMRRQMGSTFNRRVCTKLYDEEITSSVSTFNPSNYAKYTLTQTPTSLTIEYQELTSTGAILYTDFTSIPNTPDPEHPYHVVLYASVTPGCVMRFPLRRTVINCPSTSIQHKERIWWLENPSSYTPPIAPMRDYGPHIYKHPTKALVEDAVISVGSSYASMLWWNILKYLVDSNLETFIFRDIDGYTFRCVFGELTSDGGTRTTKRGPGYTLTMPVVVVH